MISSVFVTLSPTTRLKVLRHNGSFIVQVMLRHGKLYVVDYALEFDERSLSSFIVALQGLN